MCVILIEPRALLSYQDLHMCDPDRAEGPALTAFRAARSVLAPALDHANAVAPIIPVFRP